MKRLAAVARLQQELVRLGYKPGPVDGLFGARTGAAYADAVQAGDLDSRREVVVAARKAVAASVPRRAQVEAVYGPPAAIIRHAPQPGNHEAIQLAPGDDWVERNIVGVALPIVGIRRLHRECAGAFFGWLADVREYLATITQETWAIESFQVFVMRYSRGRAPDQVDDPAQVLVSMHTRAAAVDVNPSRNPRGKVGDQPAWFVEMAAAWGFRWGGKWRNRDDMHFEWVRP